MPLEMRLNKTLKFVSLMTTVFEYGKEKTQPPSSFPTIDTCRLGSQHVRT